MAKVYPNGSVIADSKIAVEIESMITIAGQGIAYRALLLPDRTPVFLKQLNTDLKSIHGSVAAKRFEREQSITLDTDQIPKSLASIEFEGAFFAVSEFIEGQSLEDHLNTLDTPLTVDKVRRIASELSRVLAIAHAKGIVHRDIKPANIMMADDGPIMLVDWGLCRFIDAKTLHPGSDPKGTIFFMSPEHIRDRGVDRQSDLFSLGVVLYVCLTQEYPFDGPDEESIFRSIIEDPIPPIDAVNPDVAPDLKAVIEKLVSKVKTARYPDAEALLIDLEEGFGSSIPGDRCTSCGAPVATGVRFCMKCGTAVGGDSGPFEGVLQVLNGALSGERVRLSPMGTTVGRFALSPDDDFISRNHARLFHAEGRYWIEDLDSLNGTSVNALALPRGGRHPLVPGDRIRLADTFCEFGK